VPDLSVDAPRDVRVRQVEWCTYRLPYAASFTTAHGAEHVREGLLLRLVAGGGELGPLGETADLLVGIGEAAPVPAFGGGTLADAFAVLERAAPALVGLPLGEARALVGRLDPERPGGGPPACALETALLDLAARARGVPLATLLVPGPAASVPVNATVGEADPALAVLAARRAAAAGFAGVKLKVGVAAEDAAELDRIGAVRAAIGRSARLRLDANGAWPVDRAIAIVRRAAHFDLELVEQPVPADDLDGLRRVRAAVDVPIAADEVACTPAQARRVLDAEAADVLIVKPMLAGGPSRARELLELAEARGLGVVVTSVVEAAVGVACALHVAATLGPAPLACGLATGSLLAADLATHPLSPRCGRLDLPSGPGLGLELDPAQLARFAGPWQVVPA
jgi:o-succinylbenzoate synthase